MEPEVSLLCSQLAPVLSQINPVHMLPSHFFNIHLNVILSSMFTSSKWSLFYNFTTKTLYAFHFSSICATCPAYSLIYVYVFQMISFLQFHHQNPVCISFLLHTCHMPRPPRPPWFDKLNVWEGVNNHEAPHFAASSRLLSVLPSYTETSSSAPYSRTPWV